MAGLLGLASTDAAWAQQRIEMPAQRVLSVGETVVLHGIRGAACGDPAPNWAYTRSRLSASALGTFSDGGTGVRSSRRCGGDVPVRAVRFKASKKGSEVLNLDGDTFTITVQ